MQTLEFITCEKKPHTPTTFALTYIERAKFGEGNKSFKTQLVQFKGFDIPFYAAVSLFRLPFHFHFPCRFHSF